MSLTGPSLLPVSISVLQVSCSYDILSVNSAMIVAVQPVIAQFANGFLHFIAPGFDARSFSSGPLAFSQRLPARECKSPELRPRTPNSLCCHTYEFKRRKSF